MDRLPAPRPNPFAESVRVLGVFVKAQVLLIMWEAALFAVGFAIGQVPLWPILAVFCAAFSLIPQIGTIIGIGVVLLISWISGNDLLHLGIVGATWVIVQATEGFWLTPKLMGRPLGLKPMLVFGVILVGSFVFGPIGLFLAVPALAVAMVWVRYFRRSS
jgi:predicted PurR-regulated permease PerM